MGLDIFFIEDIRKALVAINEASSATAAAAIGQDGNDVVALRYYRRGYREALVAMALAFGISPNIIDGGREKGK